MSQIEYYVKDVKITNGNTSVDALCSDIMKESVDGYDLVSILQTQDEGSTMQKAKMIFRKNLDLIHVNLEMNDEECIPETYMTAQQIQIIKSLGYIEINCKKYKVTDTFMNYDIDDDNLFVTIKLINEKDDFVCQTI